MIVRSLTHLVRLQTTKLLNQALIRIFPRDRRPFWGKAVLAEHGDSEEDSASDGEVSGSLLGRDEWKIGALHRVQLLLFVQLYTKL